MSGSTYVALYDYIASDPKELSLRKGDRVLIIDNSSLWCTVRNARGQEGFVPSNYLEEFVSRRSKIEEDEKLYQQTDLYKPTGNTKAVARYNYTIRRADELGLKKGEEIIVLEKEGDGWWRGRSGNKEGWFPANYVEEKVTEPANDTPVPAGPTVPKGKIPAICTVVALYSFASGNHEELSQFPERRLDGCNRSTSR